MLRFIFYKKPTEKISKAIEKALVDDNSKNNY